jgi:U2-associated protein SR140
MTKVSHSTWLFKTKVLNCIRAWEDMAIYPFDFLFDLRASFLGLNKKKLQFDNSNSGSDNNGQHDADIDGKPLDSSANECAKEDNEDIDGKPLNEYDEDIDGDPCKYSK